MTRKTQGVQDLVRMILPTIPQPYGEDIIEEVIRAIEHNANWEQQYDQLVDELSKLVVNSWIGRYTKDETGFETIREVDSDRCTLIQSYSKLKPFAIY